LLQKNNLSWEEIIEEDATIKDIDANTIELFRKLSIERFPQASSEKSILSLLEKLHLARDRKLTRAAILLFGKSPQDFYLHSYIKIGKFTNDETLIGMDEVYGNLFTQAEQTLKILKHKYLNTYITIDSLYRKEKLEYPEVSLREAIINAIVHRDYSSVITLIKVYPDSITIWINGELPDKLTPDKLKRKHPSYPRNQLIADVFFHAVFIERWGHGTIKMIKECNKAGLPEPVFEQDCGGMLVSFLKNNINEEYLRGLSLNDRQINAVLFTKQHGRITNGQYQELSQTSKRTATNDLKLLVEKGILMKIGVTGKGTQYILQRGKWSTQGAK
jgi:ATP-dependent DNA helicase RecG